jgi:hypothetical protein
MNDWMKRPTEVAYNLNPAFCGWLLREAAEGYAEVKPAGMPFALAFLVLPVVLHRTTRVALPRSTVTALHAWLRDNPEAHLGFAARARQLVPFAREGVIIAGSLGLMVFTDAGTLVSAGKLGKGKAALLARSAQVKSCVGKAKMVGKWFAEAGEPQTVFHMWDVSP